MSPRIAPRIAAFVFAAFATLSTLAGMDRLAAHEGAQAAQSTWAQAHGATQKG